MGIHKCCVPGCTYKGIERYRLPNPRKEQDMLKKWISIIGGDLTKLTFEDIYAKKRICRCHFEPHFHNSGNKGLLRTAIPSLYMRHHTVQMPECATSVNCYVCKKCGYETHLFVHLKQHVRGWTVSENVKTYECKKCVFQTHSILVFLLHVKDDCQQNIEEDDHTHFRESMKHILGDQNKRFDCKTKYDSYRRQINKKIVWFQCTECIFKTKHRKSLRRHILLKHTLEEKQINWLLCEYCAYLAKCTKLLKQHIITKHTKSDDIDWFQCEHCTYRAKLKEELKQHVLNRHTNDDEINWYHCEHCSYRTKRKNSLKEHVLRKHTNRDGLEKFQCIYCGYQCFERKYLNRHIKQIHVNSLLFKCGKCSYTTGRKHLLRLHTVRNHPDYFAKQKKTIECVP